MNKDDKELIRKDISVILIEKRKKNKYNLKPRDIQKAIVLDKERLKEPPFWRNDAISAWCLLENTVKSAAEYASCVGDEYWIGFYDDGAKAYAGKIRLKCSSYGGMCSYNFDSFFNPEEIENECDLEIQEKLLDRINWLIDEKIIKIEE